jgi:hypothetical protein
VQRVSLEGAGGGRRDGELLVVVIEPVLAHRDEAGGGEAGAYRRAGAVGGNGGRQRQLALGTAAEVAHPQPVASRVGAEDLLVEVQRHARMAQRLLDQQAVEIRTPDGVDHLVRALPIRLQSRVAGALVHHAAAHLDGEGAHARHHTGPLESRDAARGECQVDRAAALGRGLARVGAALVERHGVPAPREQHGEQCPGEAGADDVDGSPRLALHPPSSTSPLRRSAKRATSSKRL